MNIFKNLINRLKNNGDVKGVMFDDENLNKSIHYNNITQLPDLAKNYLFQLEFNFNDEVLNKYANYLSLSARAINIATLSRKNKYDNNTNTYILDNDFYCNILFDEFQSFNGYDFWYKNLSTLKPFTITVKMYDEKLGNIIKYFTYNNVLLYNLSELSLNTNSAEPITYTLTCNPYSMTNNI